MSSETEEQNALRSFSTKVVTARAAYGCCKKGYFRAAQAVLQMADFIQETLNASSSREVRVPAVDPWLILRLIVAMKPPGQAAAPRVYRAILVDSSGREIPGTESEMIGNLTLGEGTAIQAFANLATDKSKNAINDCVKCVSKNVLPQNKGRAYVGLTRPLGGEKHMVVRVPHR